MRTQKFKLVSASIGAGALIAMGGLGVASSGVGLAQPETEPVPSPTVPEATTGQTSTECALTDTSVAPAEAAATSTTCAAPPEPSVPVATPEITTTPTSAEPG
ncbi:MAG: hypothetical protein JST91_20880 [Actinobacteria bacterium]|nr:hypothetical protein [Actinomycetota bacterium]